MYNFTSASFKLKNNGHVLNFLIGKMSLVKPGFDFFFFEISDMVSGFYNGHHDLVQIIVCEFQISRIAYNC